MKRWLIRALALTIPVVALLLVAEIVLRALDFSYYWSFYKRPDPIRGWAPHAGAVAWQRIEGEALVEINGAGFRDLPRVVEKPPGRWRIAVLGDSFTAAVQVALDETYWRVVETKLRDCGRLGQRDVEVMSFGVSGYSTAQALLTLRHLARSYRPDLVLLAFFPANDLQENLAALDGDPMRPYFVEQNGKLVLNKGFMDTPAYRYRSAFYGRAGYFLLDHLRAVQFLDWLADGLRLRYASRNDETEVGVIQEHRVDNRIYRPPEDPVWRQAWRITERLIAELHREANAQGARFLAASLSTGYQVHPDPILRESLQQQLNVPDLFYPGRRLSALGQREGFPVVDLAPPLGLYASASGLLLHGFPNALPGAGHWNTLGHAVAGGVLAEAICRELPEAPR